MFDEKSLVLNSLSVELKNQIKILNDQQMTAFTNIVEWVKKPFGSKMGHILVGFAGTGKSLLASFILQTMNRVVLTAPSNSAVKELRRVNKNQDCCTIYSLLGLRLDQKEDELVLVSTGASKVGRYKYVILDEAGMTPAVLWPHIERAMNSGVKFLFIGDPKQLPPVGESKSIIWDKFPTSKLLKVERHDNQILSLATHVRKTKIEHLIIADDNENDEGVWYLDHINYENKLKEFAAKGEFMTGQTKAIAWRNRTVKAMNSLIRKTIFKNDSHNRFLVSDHLVLTSPYKDKNNSVDLCTDDDAVIKSITVSNHNYYPDLQCYNLVVTVDGTDKPIRVLHENSEKAYSEMLYELSQNARKGKGRELWNQFWTLKESFAQVLHGYALTAHRVQGRTLTNAFIDLSDILANPNRSEAKKCLYVAVSRPSTRLFLT